MYLFLLFITLVPFLTEHISDSLLSELICIFGIPTREQQVYYTARNLRSLKGIKTFLEAFEKEKLPIEPCVFKKWNTFSFWQWKNGDEKKKDEDKQKRK